ncbi:hypothetical protein EYZ11_001382 [Aspergillus tanneri]|uniref:Uncharacterized protein n=1 Tax=Aspergillus tanneri TaxID=1220188 RepID=A0A4S3JUS4_9EURO|nr:hypothetical protein EYZ11_001382 [Aspergillus tanneri]
MAKQTAMADKQMLSFDAAHFRRQLQFLQTNQRSFDWTKVNSLECIFELSELILIWSIE